MDKKILKWNFIFQYGWVLTNIFNSILLLPLYLKNIDKDTLGIWLATGNILSWMTLADPGVGEVLQQRIAELMGRHQHAEIKKTIGSGVAASVAILIISITLGFVFYVFVGAIIDKDVSSYPHLSSALLISIISTGLMLISFSLSGINQGLHNSAQVAISSLSANFVFLIVNILGLYLGYGVLSIALANLARALFINAYNIISLSSITKRLHLQIIFERRHFQKFIRIFSFTSASKIITGLSASLEMIVLARYISPAMITIYEINKRPINITYSLIGRHSVALMPSISHSKGTGDKKSILELLDIQFRFYLYAAIFASLLFLFNYEYIITAWTGQGQYAGNQIIWLLIASFFLNLISYFMATIGYALGDIKMNSFYNIIRNLIFGVMIFFSARYYGIIGTVVVSIVFVLAGDLFFYARRLSRLGYLETIFQKSTIRKGAIIMLTAMLAGWAFREMIAQLMPVGLYFSLFIINAGIFSLFFALLILGVDSGMRIKSKELARKYVFTPLSKIKRA